jgi:hypothetical protein
VSTRKQTTSGMPRRILYLLRPKEALIKDNTLWLRNPTVFNLSAQINILNYRQGWIPSFSTCKSLALWPHSLYYRLEELVDLLRRKIRLIESNAKCRHLKKFNCIGTLRQMLICLRPPTLLGYCLGWSSNFVVSESGQIQSVKLLQNMVQQDSNPPPTPSQPLTVCTCIYCTLTQGRGGGGVNQREG